VIQFNELLGYQVE